jgi:hypothetical protein
MKTAIREAVAGYFEWHAAEEEQDAEFLEEGARGFEAVREPFLRNAKIYRERAHNIRAGLEALRGSGPTSDDVANINSANRS